MAGKKKKIAEVIELKPVTQEYKDVFPDDDVRNGMTKQQMLEFEQKEQEELERRMNRFIKDAPKPSTQGIEDDEEEEIFTLDLENGKIIQKIEETLVIAPEGKLAEVVADLILPPPNPYAELIADIFTARALTRLYRELSKALVDIEAGIIHVPTKEAAELMQQVSVKLNNQLDELRRAWIRGTNKVNYDKIPEWAQLRIKSYIEETVGELLTLTSGE